MRCVLVIEGVSVDFILSSSIKGNDSKYVLRESIVTTFDDYTFK